MQQSRSRPYFQEIFFSRIEIFKVRRVVQLIFVSLSRLASNEDHYLSYCLRDQYLLGTLLGRDVAKNLCDLDTETKMYVFYR